MWNIQGCFSAYPASKLLNAWCNILTKVAQILCAQTDTIRPDADVMPSRVEIAKKDDPVLGQFLSFLPADFAHQPERLQTIEARLVQGIRSVVGGIDLDFNTALSPYNE